MIVKVKFVYEASILLKRHRKRDDRYLVEEMDVKVEEATDAEAPIALLVPDDNRIWTGEGQAKLPKIPYRWHGGALWSPRFHTHVPRGERPTVTTAEEMVELAREGKGYGNPFHSAPDWHWGRATRLAEIDDVKDADLGKRDTAVKQIEALAAGFLVVDGVLYERADEPVYVVNVSSGFSSPRYVSLDIKGYESTVAQKKGLDNMYRLDRPEEVVAKMKEEGWDGDALDPEDIVEILIPQCLGIDDETPALLQATTQTVTMLESRVSKMPKAKMALYADLRDAAQDATEATPELLDAARAIVDGFRGDDENGDTWAVERLAEALSRWDHRPISADAEASVPAIAI